MPLAQANISLDGIREDYEDAKVGPVIATDETSTAVVVGGELNMSDWHRSRSRGVVLYDGRP